MNTQNKDKYCTSCGAMYGANDICPSCGKHNDSLQDNTYTYAYTYNYNYNPLPQNVIQSNEQSQLFAYLTQSSNFSKRNNKQSILNFVTLTSIIITVIMLALSYLSFNIVPPLKAENARIKTIADENKLAVSKLTDEDNKANETIAELTKNFESTNAAIVELTKKADVKTPTLGQLQNTLIEKQTLISNWKKYNENFYYNIIAYISANDKVYYHKYECPVMKTIRKDNIHSVEMAKQLGYKPCPQCQKIVN